MLANAAPTLLLLASDGPWAKRGLLASSGVADTGPRISDPAGILAVLLGVLAIIFWMTRHETLGRIFKVVPALVFCYFVPTTLTTLGVIPDESPLYSWIKAYVLPAALLLLILSLDLPAILRLGPKAIIMLLAGTLGVVIGGPLALLVCHSLLPDDAWRGMAALSGSWIGGGANYVAIGDIAKASDSMMATMVIPDVFCASIWMGCLLYMAGQQKRIDGFTGADASSIRALERKMTEFQERVGRIPALADLLIILAFGFVGSYVSYEIANHLPEIGDMISASTWKYIIVTAVGVALSYTPARNLEGAGASKIGSVMIYLLVACIGAGADFTRMLHGENAWLLVAGFVWLAVHVATLLTVAWLIKAPIFFVAVGSQANIGGAASAPVVAAAFHPALAPVGALLAVAGYVLGTYAGLLCMRLLMWIAGATEI
jgi:uncharacterized membrane protein